MKTIFSNNQHDNHSNKTDEAAKKDAIVQKRRRNVLIRIRPLLRWVLRLRSTPRAIAGGFAMGVFVAFTPTVGLQLVGVVILTTLLKLNRAAAIAPVWISNPFTVAPIYSFNYWLGLKFCDGPPLKQVSGLFVDIGKSMAKMEIWQMKEQFAMVMHMSKDVILPLCIGSVVVGIVCAIVSYFSTLHLLEIFFARRKKKSCGHKNQKS